MIDAQTVIDTLREVVAEKGEDFVYVDSSGTKADPDGLARCMYVHNRLDNPVPGCAVGVVHFKLFNELVPEDMEFDTPAIRGEWNSLKSDVEKFWGERYSSNARDLLVHFQIHQDAGTRYGDALRFTLEYAESKGMLVA
jgi:hypothetical protein